MIRAFILFIVATRFSVIAQCLPQHQDIALHLDASCVSTPPGSPVANWRSIDVQRHVAMAEDDGQAPTLKRVPWARHPVMDFDGVNDQLSCTLEKLDTYTVAAVFAHAFSPGEQTGALWTANDGAPGQSFIPFTQDERYSLYKSWRKVSGDSPFKKHIPYIVLLEVERGKFNRIRLYCNNGKIRDCWARIMPGGQFRIGSDQLGHFRGQLAEFVVYRRILTPAERTRLCLHLSDKWLNPVLVAQGPVVVPVPNGSTCINAAVLEAKLGSRSAASLSYTLVAPPKHGQLFLQGAAVSANASWLQDDLNALRLSYHHGGAGTTDQFRIRICGIEKDAVLEADIPIRAHPLVKIPITSHTSPVCIEGDCVGVTAVQAGEQAGVVWDRKRFYADVPITPGRPGRLQIVRGAHSQTIPVATRWDPLDMAEIDEITVRRGDTLLLTAGTSKVVVNSAGKQNAVTIKRSKAFPLSMPSLGLTTIQAIDKDQVVASLTVHVVSIDFLGPIPCAPKQARSKRVAVYGDMQQMVLFQSADPHLVLVHETNRDGNFTDLQIRLRTCAPGWILARLGKKGPVLASIRIDPCLSETRARYGIGVIDHFPNGKPIFKGTLTLHPRYPNLDVLFRFNRRSMIGPDGTPYLLVPGNMYRPGIPGTIRFTGGDLGKGGGVPYGFEAFDNGVRISSDD